MEATAILIMEGASRCGKTSVALALRDHFGLVYLPAGGPTKGVPSFRYYSWLLANAQPFVVVDRLYWSALAYDVTYRGGLSLTLHQWRLLELACLALDACVVHLTDDPAGIEARWDAERLQAGPSWGLPAVLEHFRALAAGESFPRSYLPAVTLRLPDLLDAAGEPTKKLEELAKEARRRATQAAVLPPPALGIGSVRAEFMIIGEGPAPGAPPRDEVGSTPDLPFSRGPASEWLWRAADELGLRWWRGYYCNASTYRWESPWFFQNLLLHLPNLRRIVCLGEAAARLVERHERALGRVGVGYAYHPSFVRQFRHKEFGPWRDEVGLMLVPWLDHPGDLTERVGIAEPAATGAAEGAEQ